METRRDQRHAIRKRRRARYLARLNAAAAVLLAAILVGMLNYLSARHYRRVDISRGRFYALSEKTLKLLASLPGPVDVIVFFTPDDDRYEDITNLLEQYSYHSPLVRVEHVNPHIQLARAEDLAATYGLDRDEVVLFTYEGRRARVVSDSALYETVYDEREPSLVPSAAVFRGEVEFSSAIRHVTYGHRPVVYYLQGHGERNLRDVDPEQGYSDIADALDRDHVELRSLVLGERKTVPADADVLLVAGPARKFAQPEVDIIRRYLQRNGRLLLLLDWQRDTGLEPLLEDWGVQAPNHLVVDGTRTLTGRDLYVSSYGNHPITHPLQEVVTVFHLPRLIEPETTLAEGTDPADRARVTRLILSSDQGWAETDAEQNPMRFDPGRDRPGPVSLGVAVEKGASASVDVELQPTRLAVIGDADFIANGTLTGGNADLFLSAMNWLLEREDMMAIDAKPMAVYRLVLGSGAMRKLFWVVVAGLPGGVAVLGLLVGLWRRM